MARVSATIDEIIATFSAHIAKSYPAPSDFRRNFDILLWGKRDRVESAGYTLSLEKNIVFLNGLIDMASSLVERLIDPERGIEEKELAGLLEDIEKKAHASTAARHERAFIRGEDPEFGALVGDRAEGGSGYVEKLEFNYRYLMTLRLFLFEFISVLAAVRSDYDMVRPSRDDLRKMRGQLGIMANYYLGNVSVGEPPRGPEGEGKKE
jgi:hypothetical protein